MSKGFGDSGFDDSRDLDQFFTASDFEPVARKVMDRALYEYVSGGAGDEITLRENKAAFDRIFLRPRVLTDVSTVDTSIELFGRKFKSPILLAPAAYQRSMHPEGELATVRGAGERDVPVVLSTRSTTAIEDLMPGARTPIWFQLYVLWDRKQTEALIQRVETAGAEAICVTVDSPVLGSRFREMRAGFRVPEGLPLPHCYSGTKDSRSEPHPTLFSPLTWKDMEWLRSVIRGKLFFKGILHPADAELAIQSGADGIMVSNHGARNLDTILPTIEALPDIVEAVAGRGPVILDGGIRSGVDILKGMMRGADAVMIGRPYLYALAVAGADGVARCLELLQNDLAMVMTLAGRSSIADLDRSLEWPSYRV
jgi:4-hydroxymandelate oxidase